MGMLATPRAICPVVQTGTLTWSLLMFKRLLAPIVLVAAAGGCSSADDTSTAQRQSDPEAPTPPEKMGENPEETVKNPEEPGEPPVAPPSDEREWTRLVEGSWTLEPGGEILEDCHHKEVTEDLYISAIRPVHPRGTHHTLLSSSSDGSIGCNASLGVNGLIYAAGVGSEGVELPPGVAIKIPAGRVLGLGLHLYNTSTEELSGTSAMEVVLMDASDVEYEAEAMLAGPVNLEIPPGRHSQQGECVLTEDENYFAYFPHMHQMGRHMKATFVRNGKPQVFHDEEYLFEEQYQIAFEQPVALKAGDSILTECTWENATASTITFGESSDTEMCFNILFQYPARGRAFCGSFGGSGTRVTLSGPACATEDDVGNDLGIGRQCAAGGTECVGSDAFCLADFVDGDAANFCTIQCASDDECGDGAACSGRVCYPKTCAESFGG